MKKILFLSFLLALISCNSRSENHELNISNLILSETEKVEILQKSQEIAIQSQQVLGGQLMQQLQEKGSLGALDFCSVHAIAITDELSETHETRIKRVSDKPRNQNNLANFSQLDYMEKVKEKLRNNEKLEGFLSLKEDSAQAYFPILTNAMCLQCHGVPGKDISEETFAKINEIYPEDKATHYGENELRGIWVIDVILK